MRWPMKYARLRYLHDIRSIIPELLQLWNFWVARLPRRYKVQVAVEAAPRHSVACFRTN